MEVANASTFECPPRPSKRRSVEDTPTDGAKVRRLSRSPPIPGDSCQSPRNEVADQLPLPSLTKCDQKNFPPPPSSPPLDHPVAGKRKAGQPDCLPPPKRVQSSPETAEARTTLGWWLSNLPNEEDFEDQEIPKVVNNMSQPAPRWSWSISSDSSGTELSQSGGSSEPAFSRGKEYSMYEHVDYQVGLEMKGSFMRPSEAGMVKEDKELCKSLLTTSQPIVSDALFSDDHFDKFHLNLHGRSKPRICLDLHPRLMPSVENLYICGREEFAGFIEGHNDRWVKSIPFYGPCPQPDHTYGFKWSNFTEQQRRKLMIEPTENSYYTAREDIYFPFLTAEVTCGQHGLYLVDKPNIHSMTIQMRGIVDLYRKINRPKDVHGRVLGFSISHNNNEMFALPLVERLKAVIDELPDPLSQSLKLAATFDSVSVQDSQDDLSIPESELRNMIEMLQQQLERQQREAKAESERQEREAKEESERQQREAQERKTLFLAQLEQQQKNSEQQQKKSEQQLNELMGMLKEHIAHLAQQNTNSNIADR
ncbi:hypothetical protein MMC07_000692 [Pseudocyphellaria aurata]|nr:hypothetical protein [Pseudocyphellaria aurata]